MQRTGVALIGPFVLVFLYVLEFIQWTVFAWVILSWIVFFASQTSFRWRHKTFFNILLQLNDLFTRMTAPMLRPFRRLLRRFDTHGIDWSPMLLWLSIFLLRLLVSNIYGLILTP